MREDLKQNIQEADDQNIELRILCVPVDREINSPFHDRFILSTEGGLTIGTSFNSLDSSIIHVTKIAQADAVDLLENSTVTVERRQLYPLMKSTPGG